MVTYRDHLKGDIALPPEMVTGLYHHYKEIPIKEIL